ncbi:MAG: hypothetical protein HQM02_13770, partial [Magnetococcales bacterium]|nr:hypothetical protein [Magnetococcales bacterium]
MNNIMIGFRLGLSYFVLLLIVGIAFSVSLVKLKEVERQVVQVRDKSVPFALLAEKMSGDVNAVQQFLTDASLTGEREAVKEALEFAQGVRSGLDQFGRMFNEEHHQEGSRRVETIHNRFEAFLKTGQEMVDA